MKHQALTLAFAVSASISGCASVQYSSDTADLKSAFDAILLRQMTAHCPRVLLILNATAAICAIQEHARAERHLYELANKPAIGMKRLAVENGCWGRFNGEAGLLSRSLRGNANLAELFL
jgi:hypothetical protein